MSRHGGEVVKPNLAAKVNALREENAVLLARVKHLEEELVSWAVRFTMDKGEAEAWRQLRESQDWCRSLQIENTKLKKRLEGLGLHGGY